MEQVVKVSIAGCAFVLDVNACRKLDVYLNELKEHYGSVSGSGEIVEDIEERIAELLAEGGSRDRIVSSEEIGRIIDILGRPCDIDGNASEYGSSPGAGSGPGTCGDSGVRDKQPAARKLYRDPEHKILGGVCSGLAAYLNLDMLAVRLLFIAVALGLFGIWHVIGKFVFWPIGWPFGGFWLSVLVYCILWVVVPAADTVAQRCAMRGESPGVDGIQQRFCRESRRMGSRFERMGREAKQSVGRAGHEIGRAGSSVLSMIGKILVKVFGVFLLVAGMAGLVCGAAVCLGVEWLDGLSLWSLTDYIRLDLSHPVWMKVCMLLSWFLPFIGMIYVGIRFLFGLRSPRWKPGVILFVLWLAVLAGGSLLTVSSLRPYFGDYTNRTVNEEPVKAYDTLYVRFQPPAEYVDARVCLEAGPRRFDLMYYTREEGDEKGRRFFAYPRLQIVQRNEEAPFRLDYRRGSFDFSGGLSDLYGNDAPAVYSLKDSLITLYPAEYSKERPFDGTSRQLRLYVPEYVKVIALEPVRHVFGSSYCKRNPCFWW